MEYNNFVLSITQLLLNIENVDWDKYRELLENNEITLRRYGAHFFKEEINKYLLLLKNNQINNLTPHENKLWADYLEETLHFLKPFCFAIYPIRDYLKNY